MCGRFTQAMSWKKLHDLYQLPRQSTPLNLRPRWNGCPTQDFAVLRLENSERAIAKLRWGLVPAWAKDVKMGARLINARAETVHGKPAFRAAFRRRRCLIPADGWFEWRVGETGNGKQPWFITSADGRPVSFAGLWERWEKGEEPIETFTILTTAASSGLAAIHHRPASHPQGGGIRRVAGAGDTARPVAGACAPLVRGALRPVASLAAGEHRAERRLRPAAAAEWVDGGRTAVPACG